MNTFEKKMEALLAKAEEAQTLIDEVAEEAAEILRCIYDGEGLFSEDEEEN